MATLQVKKVVAVCFLEAVKTTLDHLGVYRLELSERGATSPPELTRAYGDGRRLRDYLQRCVSGFNDDVALDLADADLSLLVACCRRFIEANEQRIETTKLTPDEREWLEKKMQVLAHWAIEIAAKPLLELPLKRNSRVGAKTRALSAQLNDKLFGETTAVQPTPSQRAPSTGAASSSMPSSMRGVPSFGDELFAAPCEPGAAPQLDENSWGTAQAPAARTKPAVQPISRLIDVQKIVEPRLRALSTVDLHAYDRAVAAGDWRMATILAAAVLEVAVLDYALPRQEELALVGTPDTWDIQQLLDVAMRDHGDPRDQAMAAHVFAARNMLRPAVQLANPTIVTQVSFERLRDFVRRVLHCLGFAVQSQEAADAWAAPARG